MKAERRAAIVPPPPEIVVTMTFEEAKEVWQFLTSVLASVGLVGSTWRLFNVLNDEMP